MTSRIRYNKLYHGAKMDSEKFHLLYCGMPENYKAELLAGRVYEPPPPGIQHGEIHIDLGAVFAAYGRRTMGLDAIITPTIILSPSDEPEPDLILRVRPEFGGQSTTVTKRCSPLPAEKANFIKGAPELVAEVAFSSRWIDLNLKKQRYQLAGVLEYIVVEPSKKKLTWFDLKNTCNLKCHRCRTFRSSVFPGLWINEAALSEGDYDLLMKTLETGMQSAEYKTFADTLTKRMNQKSL